MGCIIKPSNLEKLSLPHLHKFILRSRCQVSTRLIRSFFPYCVVRRVASMMIWRCFICYIFVALSLRKLLSHINSLHSRSPDFRVVCGIDGCSNEYRVYNSYYYHIKRTHTHHLLDMEGPVEENPPTFHGGRAVTEDALHVGSTHLHTSEIDGSSMVSQPVSYCLCCLIVLLQFVRQFC